MLYAVTKLNSVDVRSLCSCTVGGRMTLSSVLGRMSLLLVVCVCVCVCVCAWSSCPGKIWSESRIYGPKHVGASF
jgi:hypothetical protein